MEFAVLFIGEGKVAGIPLASLHLRQWVARCLPLLIDKNPGVRRMAARALACLHDIDAAFMTSCLQQASSKEVVAFERAMASPGVLGGQSRPASPGDGGAGYGEEGAGYSGYATAGAGGSGMQYAPAAAGSVAAVATGGMNGASSSTSYAGNHHAAARAPQQPGWPVSSHTSAAAAHVPTTSAPLPSSAAAAAAAAAAPSLNAELSSISVLDVGGDGSNAVQHDVLGRTFVAPVGPQQPHVEVSEGAGWCEGLCWGGGRFGWLGGESAG